MQGNGNEYGRPYDPFAQERPSQYETRQQMPRKEYGQGAQYPMMEDAYAPRKSHAYSPPSGQGAQSQYYHAPNMSRAPQASESDAPIAQPMPQQDMQPSAQNVYDMQMELDAQDSMPVYESASHDFPFVQEGTKFKNVVIAGVLTLVLVCGGFVASKIKMHKAKDTVSQQISVSMPQEDTLQQAIDMDAPTVKNVVLNTTEPVFGSARLQITFEVKSNGFVRIDILNADGTVFYTIEDALEVDKGELRTYFDGTDAEGNWIQIGSYQVRVSGLSAAREEGAADIQWTVDNSMCVDFVVNTEPKPTQNSNPDLIATPTPSVTPTPSEELMPSETSAPSATPTVSPNATATATPTPTPSQSVEATPTSTPSEEAATPTPAPTVEATPTLPPVLDDFTPPVD